MDAIESDEQGRAKINTEKCVSCGMCMVSCPFGAISDKSQIFQLCKALREGQYIVAEVAPAHVGQFGKKVSYGKLKAALMALGFRDVYEVALGADIGAVAEAHHYAEKVVTGRTAFPSYVLLSLLVYAGEEILPRSGGQCFPGTDAHGGHSPQH